MGYRYATHSSIRPFNFNSKINAEQIPRGGRGQWKFNVSLLGDENFVSNIKQIIRKTNDKYHYNMMDKCIVWELIKLNIRNYTIPYSINKKGKK